ncbi:hypothetical protein OG439_32000 [Amycolatopsis sp. NBC_01307]|uniref:hypothetical protein n=1 Tax=Amycolatopsis sp. NBC_01307 TaxID=2903561 RepID=UPI002E0E0F85|nr:hypothetical protein OG439_32000 [Amycolatopsis sp. NBC_01307]
MYEPTEAEVDPAGLWLAKRGVEVVRPTPLLALRLGARRAARPPGYWAWCFLVLAVAVVAGGVLQFLALWLHTPMGGVVFAAYAGVVVLVWLPVRWADRRAAALLGDRRLDVPRPPWRESLDGWYLASVLITFGGGALLAVAMCVTTSAWVWAVGWLGMLAIGALVVAVVLTGVLRRPVLAEDETSLMIDAVVRAEDPYITLPALFALPVLFDPLTTGRQPHEFTPWLVGYVVLAFATLLVGRYRQYRRRTLPAGTYGVEVAVR